MDWKPPRPRCAIARPLDKRELRSTTGTGSEHKRALTNEGNRRPGADAKRCARGVRVDREVRGNAIHIRTRWAMVLRFRPRQPPCEPFRRNRELVISQSRTAGRSNG